MTSVKTPTLDHSNSSGTEVTARSNCNMSVPALCKSSDLKSISTELSNTCSTRSPSGSPIASLRAAPQVSSPTLIEEHGDDNQSIDKQSADVRTDVHTHQLLPANVSTNIPPESDKPDVTLKHRGSSKLDQPADLVSVSRPIAAENRNHANKPRHSALGENPSWREAQTMKADAKPDVTPMPNSVVTADLTPGTNIDIHLTSKAGDNAVDKQGDKLCDRAAEKGSVTTRFDTPLDTPHHATALSRLQGPLVAPPADGKLRTRLKSKPSLKTTGSPLNVGFGTLSRDRTTKINSAVAGSPPRQTGALGNTARFDGGMLPAAVTSGAAPVNAARPVASYKPARPSLVDRVNEYASTAVRKGGRVPKAGDN